MNFFSARKNLKKLSSQVLKKAHKNLFKALKTHTEEWLVSEKAQLV